MEGGKRNKVKTQFSLNDNVFSMLVSGYSTEIAERVERAVESALNDHALVKSADAKRSDVKLKTTGKAEAKRSVTTFSEAERYTYQANANGPSRFAAWHDQQTAVWTKHGEPSGEMPIALLPAHLVVWIAGFKPATPAIAPGTPEAPKVDGARRESIPTPEEPEEPEVENEENKIPHPVAKGNGKGNGKRNSAPSVAPVEAPKV